MHLERTISEYVETTQRLLALERQAEIEEAARLERTLSAEELESRGLAYLRLRIAGVHVALGGRTILELEPRRKRRLPAGRIGTGDIVAISSMSSERRSRRLLTGVVCRLAPGGLSVALDGEPDDLPRGSLRADRIANDVTYQRMHEGLERLRKYRGGPSDRLRKVLFGDRTPFFVGVDPIEAFKSHLDASQREAASFAMAAQDIALIHGPPGTGKTTTLAEVIHQAVARGERVLACAGSNVAVDNLVERLAERDLDIVRVGHPARLLPSVLEHSLDRLVENEEARSGVSRLRRELRRAREDLLRTRKRRHRRELKSRAGRLAAELRRLEERAVRSVLSDADVVLATHVGSGDALLAGMSFDLVVIDEAAQSLEPAAWIPLLKGRRAVLAGDHRQLPPTICSRDAERLGLGVTLFERLSALLGDPARRMLTVQYRMHERIMEWSSAELYGGRIEAHESVRRHLLLDLAGCAATEDTRIPVLSIDTSGCGLEEARRAESPSRSNDGEARVVIAHIERLLAAGVRPAEIAVITPYNDQVRLLRKRLSSICPDLEIGSVDGFQGREKEAVVISMVRSNPRGEIGFLADDRRMNVAVTRARRHVAIIGDSATVSTHPFLGRLLEYCRARGEYRSAWQYLERDGSDLLESGACDAAG